MIQTDSGFLVGMKTVNQTLGIVAVSIINAHNQLFLREPPLPPNKYMEALKSPQFVF